MTRSVAWLGLAVLMVLLVLLAVRRWRNDAPKTKRFDILVTYVATTNESQGTPLVGFRISNPYPREIWYVPPKRGSTNSSGGPWQFPFRFLDPHESEVVWIAPPFPDPGTNRWWVTFRSGLRQQTLQRLTDPLIDRLRKASRRYGDNIRSVDMVGMNPTPQGALFSGIVEGDAHTVSQAIADGASLNYRLVGTPLHLNSMYSGSTGVAAVLMYNGVPRLFLDHDGETAADVARRNGHLHLARFLEPPQPSPAERRSP